MSNMDKNSTKKLDTKGLKLKPRNYQIKASLVALTNKKSVIVMPTGTGKTLIGLIWASNLLKKKFAKKILILEPTRIMVEQTAEYFKKIGNLDAVPVHGEVPKETKEQRWKGKIVVTTPEEAIVYSEILNEFDAVLVDECHHSVGEDAYKKVLEIIPAEWRLGLSAHIPSRHKKTIKKLIGEIFEWSTDDPDVSKYIPDWIGEIYETPLDQKAMKVYKEIEKLRSTSSGKERMIYSLALRFLSRDGAVALKESLKRTSLLAKRLKVLEKEIMNLENLHKLKKLLRAMDHHEFSKAIIFVERVIVAKELYKILQEENPVLIIGKRKDSSSRVKEALKEAKKEETRVIISTSAGEEGIDLPSADFLILWSNIVSPLRFIQRHGRILRKTKPLKYIAYLVTPETVDMNAFLDSIYFAKKAGIDIGIDEETVKKLLHKSPRANLLGALESPMPPEWIAEATGMSRSEVNRSLKLFMEQGELFYVYTSLGKTIAKTDQILMLLEEFPDYFNPKNIEGRVIIGNKVKRKRTIEGNYEVLQKKLFDTIQKEDLDGITIILKEIKTGIEYVYVLKYNFRISSKEVLEIVLKNAFTELVYKTYG